MVQVTGEQVINLLRIAERNGNIDAAISVAETWIKGAEEEIHRLKQVMKEAKIDIGCGVTHQAFNKLAKETE